MNSLINSRILDYWLLFYSIYYYIIMELFPNKNKSLQIVYIVLYFIISLLQILNYLWGLFVGVGIDTVFFNFNSVAGNPFHT